MKQKCQLQIDVTQYKNEAMSLSISGIKTTLQHFQMKYNFVLAQGAQKLSAKVKM